MSLRSSFSLSYQAINSSFHHKVSEPCFCLLFHRGESTTVSYCIEQSQRILKGGHNVVYALHSGQSIFLQEPSSNGEVFIIFLSSKASPSSFLTAGQEVLAEGYCTRNDRHLGFLLNTLYEPPLSPETPMKRELTALEICKQLLENFTAENSKKSNLRSGLFEKVMLAKRTIDEDIARNYTITDLAKTVGTNVQYLKKYFKHYVGKTIMTYSTEKKMQCAKRLIMEGNHRIADVARMTGYKHSTHFTTAFKKHFGVVPNSFRYYPE